MVLWIVLRLVLSQRATRSNRALTSPIHLALLSRLPLLELFCPWQSQIIGLSGNLTSIMPFLMDFCRKKFTWIRHPVMLILNILHMSVSFVVLSMASSKLPAHGFIASAPFSWPLASLIVLQTHPYLCSPRMMT